MVRRGVMQHDLPIRQARNLMNNRLQSEAVPARNETPLHSCVWGSGGAAPLILTLVLDGDHWSASRPGRFTSG
jgi:hypothetical protein